jgi:glycosyltransferase involved in cell wall biosynthesis
VADRPPLSILQAAGSLYDWGSIEKHVLYLRQGLTERGHQVELIAPSGSQLALTAHCPQLLAVRKHHSLAGIRGYLNRLRHQRYDVVHAHFGPDFVPLGIAARLTKQPLVVLTRHMALPWKPTKVRLYGSLYHRFIAVSQTVRDRLVTSGVPPDRIVVALAGCPAPTRTLTRQSKEGLQIGGFGRLVPEKGFDLFFDAAPHVPSDVSFHIYGSGPCEGDFRIRSSDRVQLHGHVRDVEAAMASLDAVAIPSRIEEALSYSAIEALAVGTPILAMRSGGLREVLAEGEVGFGFDNLQSFLHAIENLRTADRHTLSTAARARHREFFSLEAMAAHVETAYYQD